MNRLDISKIKAIIWDLDNTLYRFNAALEQACNIAAGRAAVDLGVPLAVEEAVRIAEESFYARGYSGHVFEQEYKICMKSYHHAYHDAVDVTVIEKNEEMKNLLSQSPYPHVILTNADRGWANRTLDHLGMTEFFPAHKVIPQEDADYQPKARSARGVEIALEKLRADLPDLNTEEVLMVDDLVRNLKFPKEMGLQTAYIIHGKHEDIPNFVDAVFDDTISLMKELLGSVTYSAASEAVSS